MAGIIRPKFRLQTAAIRHQISQCVEIFNCNACLFDKLMEKTGAEFAMLRDS